MKAWIGTSYEVEFIYDWKNRVWLSTEGSAAIHVKENEEPVAYLRSIYPQATVSRDHDYTRRLPWE